MIKLKSSNNVQTFYIAKGCSDVCISDNTLPMGSYTKAEADERFQPKGDYPTLEDVNIIKEDLENNIDELSNTLSSEIAELEVSKQETFQVNQPLYFERSDEDLTLNVNLEDYATKEDLENISAVIPTLKYNASTNKFEGDFQAVYSAITSEDTPFSIYLPHNNEVIETTLAFVNGNNITAYASITYTGNSMHFAYYIKPDGTYTNAISQFQAQEELTPGDNIEIDDDLVINWVAPDIQFVNTIFTDDEMLKYAIADFKGGYTEKEFPLATTTSAGLMSPEDKAKLDAGSSGESTPYLYIVPSGYQYKLGDGDYTAVKDAVINDKPCLIYWVNNTRSGTAAQFGDFTSLFETAEWVDNVLQIRFHFEEGNVHTHYLFNISDDGTVTSARQTHSYVTQTEYDAKIAEIDEILNNLQPSSGVPTIIVNKDTGEATGSYSDVFDAVTNGNQANVFLYDPSSSLNTIYAATEIAARPAGIGAESIDCVFHSEQPGFSTSPLHYHYKVIIYSDLTTTIYTNKVDYVLNSDYNTKVLEIDTAISDLQAQIGDIATVLDNIQGEVI